MIGGAMLAARNTAVLNPAGRLDMAVSRTPVFQVFRSRSQAAPPRIRPLPRFNDFAASTSFPTDAHRQRHDRVRPRFQTAAVLVLTRCSFLDRLFLNMGTEKPIGKDKNRSEIPFRLFMMKQVMFAPNAVKRELGNPVLGNAMVGLMQRRPKCGIADARYQNESDPSPAEEKGKYEQWNYRRRDAQCVDVDVHVVAAFAMMLNGVFSPPRTLSQSRIVHEPAMRRVLGEWCVKKETKYSDRPNH
ncbi:MAG TPA: hypothetical protein VIF02_02580 [Methylocella sp.]|jgi:hypothetical protein